MPGALLVLGFYPYDCQSSVTGALMHLSALILYGSKARQDDQALSDTDLLGTWSGATFERTAWGRVNISVYPTSFLLAQARAGGLFVAHIVKEGRPLFDPGGVLDAARAAFKPKINYSSEIADAVDLGWFLIDRAGEGLPASTYNRRVAWVVRTILTARSAQEHEFKFAASEIAGLANYQLASFLMESKDAVTEVPELPRNLRKFLIEEDLQRSNGHGPLTEGQYERLFIKSGNEFGLRSLLEGKGEPVVVTDYD